MFAGFFLTIRKKVTANIFSAKIQSTRNYLQTSTFYVMQERVAVTVHYMYLAAKSFTEKDRLKVVLN